MKIRKIITVVMTSIAGLMVVLSGVMKFSRKPELVAKLAAVGMADYVLLLGSMEFAFIALFLFPKTMRIGFILLNCYFAGAMATDLSHGLPMVNAGMVLVLIWIAAFLRDRDLFLFSAKRKVELA